MSDQTLEPATEAATAYESLMVPALFGQWAPRVVQAARIRPGQRVLDVACGTGVLGREAARRAGPKGSVVGLDPNPGMLAVAGRLEPTIDWRRGTAESLPFPDGSFDAVVSQFGLMFCDAPTAALREALRVLNRGGRLAFAVWDAVENIPAYAAEVELLDRLAGRAAADAVRGPFALGDGDALARLFEDAGVEAVEVRTERGTGRFPSVRAMLEADLHGWLPVMGVHLSADVVERVLAEGESVLGRWVVEGGEVEFELTAHVVVGRQAAAGAG